MSNDNNPTQTLDMQAALAALLQQAQGTPQAPAIGGWNAPKPQGTPANVLGVSVPVALQTPIGKVRVYLAFGPEHAASPAALNALLEQLANSGIPVDAWQSGRQQGSGGWGGNSNSGGFNSYRRRY